MPQEPIVPAAGSRGRILVEPAGYAVTSFLTGVGLTIGIGLAPDGLLLFAAALILEVIELRRLRAANPWMRFDTPDDVRTFEGRTIMRYSTWNAGVVLAMGITAYALVNTQPGEGETTPMGADAAAIGPALVAGVMVLAFNYLAKRKLAKGPGPGDDSPRAGDEPAADEQAASDEPYRPENWVAEPEADGDRDPALPAPYDPPPPGPDDEDDDGFQDQDYSALHGKRLEPRTGTKSSKPSKSRRRGGRGGRDAS